MKKFDLEAAKNGAAVCIRDGSPARIICWDRVDKDFPIIALVTTKVGNEVAWSYTIDGKYNVGNRADSLDLMMASEKHEGWANILVGSACKSDLNRYFSGIFSTKEEAQRYNTDNIVDCVKIEWEE